MLLAAALELVSLFPAGAKIIESQPVWRDRVIVLWMIAPVEDPTPCPSLEEWAESCPDRTEGCHFHGPTRVSLVDSSVPRVMNTIGVDDPWTGEDAFDIPIKVMTPGPYRFDRRTRRPLLGYSVRRDALIQYAVHENVDGKEYDGMWVEHLLNIKPIRPRFWRFTLGYPPGPPDVPFEHWTVRYDRRREAFDAKVVTSMKR